MSLATLKEGAQISLDAYVADLAWSPDGASLAVAGGEGAVVRVEQVASAPKARAIGEHGMGVIAVAWQPGGKLFASTGQDSAVVLWDASSGNAVARLRPGTSWTEQIAFSPDGKLLFVFVQPADNESRPCDAPRARPCNMPRTMNTSSRGSNGLASSTSPLVARSELAEW